MRLLRNLINILVMKKIIYSFALLLFFSLNIFSQEKESLKKSCTQLLELNNGDAIFTKLIEDNIYNIKDYKQEEFRRKATELAMKKKEEAILFFSKKYSKEDIQEIQKEYASGSRYVQSKKAQDFIEKWRFLKKQFYSDFKKLYSSYL